MEWANETLVTEFVFLSFSSLAGLQRLLFAVFLLVYLFMLGTNAIIVSTIVLDRALHTPMYFFLGVLSCSETCYTFVIVPKMLVDLLAQKKTISFLGCAIQMFFFLFLSSPLSIRLLLIEYLSCARHCKSVISFSLYVCCERLFSLALDEETEAQKGKGTPKFT